MLDSGRSRKTKTNASAQRAAAAEKREREERERQRAAARRMEQSYDVIGASDSHSDGSPSEENVEVEEDVQLMNGEEVRGEVEAFLKKQLVQTVVAATGFVMAVVGIWGDGAPQGMAYVRTRGVAL